MRRRVEPGDTYQRRAGYGTGRVSPVSVSATGSGAMIHAMTTAGALLGPDTLPPGRSLARPAAKQLAASRAAAAASTAGFGAARCEAPKLSRHPSAFRPALAPKTAADGMVVTVAVGLGPCPGPKVQTSSVLVAYLPTHSTSHLARSHRRLPQPLKLH